MAPRLPRSLAAAALLLLSPTQVGSESAVNESTVSTTQMEVSAGTTQMEFSAGTWVFDPAYNSQNSCNRVCNAAGYACEDGLNPPPQDMTSFLEMLAGTGTTCQFLRAGSQTSTHPTIGSFCYWYTGGPVRPCSPVYATSKMACFCVASTTTTTTQPPLLDLPDGRWVVTTEQEDCSRTCHAAVRNISDTRVVRYPGYKLAYGFARDKYDRGTFPSRDEALHACTGVAECTSVECDTRSGSCTISSATYLSHIKDENKEAYLFTTGYQCHPVAITNLSSLVRAEVDAGFSCVRYFEVEQGDTFYAFQPSRDQYNNCRYSDTTRDCITYDFRMKNFCYCAVPTFEMPPAPAPPALPMGPDGQWVLGNENLDCNAVCTSKSLQCVDGATPTVSKLEEMYLLGEHVGVECASAYEDSYGVAPAVGTGPLLNQCIYNYNSQSSPGAPRLLGQSLQRASPTCESAWTPVQGVSMKRICWCVAAAPATAPAGAPSGAPSSAGHAVGTPGAAPSTPVASPATVAGSPAPSSGAEASPTVRPTVGTGETASPTAAPVAAPMTAPEVAQGSKAGPMPAPVASPASSAAQPTEATTTPSGSSNGQSLRGVRIAFSWSGLDCAKLNVVGSATRANFIQAIEEGILEGLKDPKVTRAHIVTQLFCSRRLQAGATSAGAVRSESTIDANAVQVPASDLQASVAQARSAVTSAVQRRARSAGGINDATVTGALPTIGDFQNEQVSTIPSRCAEDVCVNVESPAQHRGSLFCLAMTLGCAVLAS